jgi:hypothetical protein
MIVDKGDLPGQVSLVNYKRASDIPANEWNNSFGPNRLLMHKESLLALEKNSDTIFTPSYFILKSGETIIPFYFQQFLLKKSSVKGIFDLNGLTSSLTSFLLRFGNGVAKKNYNLVVCGNSIASGCPGFPEDNINGQLPINEKLIRSFLPELKKLHPTVGDALVVLYKDLPDHQSNFFSNSTHRTPINLPFDPFMYMKIDTDWNSFADYLSALSSKYRIKAQSTIKKFSIIKKVALKLSDIKTYSSEIEKLYSEVENKSRIRLLKVKASYFYQMKEYFEKKFVVNMFLLDNQPVAFTSALYSNGYGEAHLVGFSGSLNVEYALYQNILYSFITDAIKHKVHTLSFGRTATEIKSSVGAVPGKQYNTLVFEEEKFGTIASEAISNISKGKFIFRRPFRKHPQATTK